MVMVRSVVGGVDTHADFHVGAAVDPNGGSLGVESFGADRARYEQLLAGQLADTPLLAELSDEDLVVLAERMHELEVAADSYVVQKGELRTSST